MRYVAAALALALVCSCGGGGSSLQTAPAAEEEPAKKAWEILQECALAELEALAELVEFFQQVAAPGAEPPEFKITGIDLLKAGVNWTVDVDSDGTPDVSGTLRFEDANGNPTIPVNLLEIIAYLGNVGEEFDLPGLLDLLADGTVVALDYRVLRGTDTSGTIAVAIVDGQPGAARGTMTVNGTECVIYVEFEALLGDPGEGIYPEGAADITITSDGTTLEGVATFDGTSVITIVLVDESGQVVTFEYDLATGELTAP